MMFGYMADGPGPDAKGDAWGLPNHFVDLKAISPQTKWIASSHFPPGSWRAGPSLRAGDFLGELSWVRATYFNVRWMGEDDDAWCKRNYGWRDRTVPLILLAGSRSRSPGLHQDHCPGVNRCRVTPEAVLLTKHSMGDSRENYAYQGFGPWGADFWGNEFMAYDTYNNVALSESTVRWTVGPGQAGPVPTCRTRMLQEGLQEAEARIFVQNAILDEGPKAKLGPDLAQRSKELCDARTRMLTYMSYYRYGDAADEMPRLRLISDVAAWDEEAAKLYRLADEVQKALAKQ
jgi:hypothetical protein